MTTVAVVTPMKCSKIANLKFSEHILIYLDKDNKLKRAIPDFDEAYMDYDTSLLYEALNSEKFAVFSYVPRKKQVETPMFCVHIDDNGEIIQHNNFGDENITKLESFLLDSKKRQSMFKLLKKTR